MARGAWGDGLGHGARFKSDALRTGPGLQVPVTIRARRRVYRYRRTLLRPECWTTGRSGMSPVAVRWSVTSLLLAVPGVFALVLLVGGPGPDRAGASSHAEAPLISTDPRADNTD